MNKHKNLRYKITDITLIPGSGEYVYDTVTQEKRLGERDKDNNFIQRGKSTFVNMHNFENRANVLVALDHLNVTLPNIEWVSVVLSWFADSLDPGALQIRPGVEFNDKNVLIFPDEWAVGNDRRDTAHQISRSKNGEITYGGTPTDKSILHLVQELKQRGYKVMLYPILQIDTITPPKPWRGWVTPKKDSDVVSFFTKPTGYDNFIIHYTNLNIDGTFLKDNVDAFAIGSELKGITQYMSKAGVFPGVDALKALAAKIKTITGDRVKVTYGADWAEYHSINGWFNLDRLWSDSNIDVVSIGSYFPLTPDLPESDINYQKIYDGWTSGEGWDYYYSDQERTKKQKYYSQDYAWKDIKYWWETRHRNPDGTGSTWAGKMKPIWISELGFPSTDACSNQPGVFVDHGSIEKSYPRGSKHQVNFTAQSQALSASIDYLDDQNKLERDFIQRKFIWTWDARPYPYWPHLKEVWIDAHNWKTGHWLQGKLGFSSLLREEAQRMQEQVINSLLQEGVAMESMMQIDGSYHSTQGGVIGKVAEEQEEL